MRQEPARAPGFLRRFWSVWSLGLLGVAALALQAPPASVLEQASSLGDPSPLALRTLLLLNPLLLVTIAAATGAATAHRAGFSSRVAGTAGQASPGLLAVLVPAALCGAGLAVVIFALDAALAASLGAQWQAAKARADAAPILAGLAVGMLYGGLAEEVIMRWGLMSLVGWLLLRSTRRNARGPADGARRGAPLPGAPIAWAAIVSSAVVFALAHLPALAQMVEPAPAVVARTLGLNAMAGVLYGWLFWRRGLEAAMAAHAGTHAGLALLRWAG